MKLRHSQPKLINLRLRAVRNLERQQLESVVNALNGGDEQLNDADHAALVRFVESWNRAGRNPWKMRLTLEDRDRFSIRNLERVWTWRLGWIGQTPEAERLVREMTPRGVQSREERIPGGAYWSKSPTGDNFRDKAAYFAGLLLTNQMRGKLSDSPCLRELCGKWFIKRRSTQKQCSTRCLTIVTNVARTKKQRQKEHEEKLKLAQSATQLWKPTSRVEWKRFVSKKTHLSLKWITRAVNREQLELPRGASK
jgi:hypothetical protein